MKQYLKQLENILESGTISEDRTGVGTISLFGMQNRYDLSQGFPILTTKKISWESIVSELLWFLEGSTDERRLAEFRYSKPRKDLTDKKTIWTANSDKQGKNLGYTNNSMTKENGPIYGKQWRDFNGYDQIKTIIAQIKSNPLDRRIILSSWNVGDIGKMSLPPCHLLSQFYIRDNKLSCQMYQRSADFFLGVPFNISSYSLLTHIIAKECNLDVGEFIHVIGDAHIYKNHVNQVKKQINRTPYKLPQLEIKDNFNLSDRLDNGFHMNDTKLITLKEYKCCEPISASMAV